jgi:hypothetical protein
MGVGASFCECMIQRFVALAIAALCLGYAATERADSQTPAPTFSPVVLPTLGPSEPANPYVKMGIDFVTGLVRQQIENAKNSALGQVTFFRRFEMQVRTGANSYRDVHLHQGTVIDPRGATIVAGQRVRVAGLGQPDGSLDANIITVQQ